MIEAKLKAKDQELDDVTFLAEDANHASEYVKQEQQAAEERLANDRVKRKKTMRKLNKEYEALREFFHQRSIMDRRRQERGGFCMHSLA